MLIQATRLLNAVKSFVRAKCRRVDGVLNSYRKDLKAIGRLARIHWILKGKPISQSRKTPKHPNMEYQTGWF
jgi:hypothetical protein